MAEHGNIKIIRAFRWRGTGLKLYHEMAGLKRLGAAVPVNIDGVCFGVEIILRNDP